MATIEILNPTKHQHLSYSQTADCKLQAEQNSVMVFANEIAHLALVYPIVIQKNPENGRFCLVALLGLQKGENLFVDKDHWRVPQIPLAMSRGPFALTFRQSTESNAGTSPLIGIDTDSPALVKNTEIQPREYRLFDGEEPTAFINEIKNKLQAIHQGLGLTDNLLEKLNSLALIEPVNISIQLTDAESYTMNGNYSVNEEKLKQLPESATMELFESGELKLIHLLGTSLNHISTLIYLKQQRLQSNNLQD